ncbi:unnamed protein product [Meloidogyne enterolobii]|uniref:Uncharacterized protein n=1 Tax=Meloidogyne enterolobii TaxID=390850 RepID=A0ACB0ZA69_MELEN
MIVRMRGLPFSATEQQIRDFFSTDGLPSGILQEGVLFVQRPDGRPSGDAFVLFCDEQSGRRALLKHRQRMGTRYIELFRTTQAEVQQLFNSKQQIINAQEKNLGGGGILTNNNLLVNNNQKTQTIITSTTSSASNGIINTLPPIFAPPINTSVATFIPFGKPTPPPFKNGRRRDCLRLRGLPYEAQVQQVVEFLGPHARHVLFQGVHMIYTSIGHPSGEAFIQMESEQAASNASQECHNKYMELGKKKRYIEVFQCCADDMSLHLNILQQSPPLIPPSAAPGLLPTPHSPLIPLPTNGTSPLFSLPATNPFLAAFAAATNVGAINEQTTNGGGGILLTPPQFVTPSLPLTHLYSPEVAAQFGGFPPPPSHPQELWLRNNCLTSTIVTTNGSTPLFNGHFLHSSTANCGGGGRGGGGGGIFAAAPPLLSLLTLQQQQNGGNNNGYINDINIQNPYQIGNGTATEV